MAYTITDELLGEGVTTLNAGVNYLFPQRAELINSALAARGPEVEALARGGSDLATIPYLNVLDSSVFNISNENADKRGETGKLTASKFMARRLNLNFGWKATDLTKMKAMYDVTGGVRAGIAQYWNDVSMDMATSSIKGALDSASNLTIERGDNSAPTDIKEIYKGLASAEELATEFNVMIIHPIRYAELQGDNAIAYDSNTRFEVSQGFRIIRSTRFGADTTILARSGALAFGFVDAPFVQGTEVERHAGGGNGVGAETLWSRRSMVVHPQGFKYVGDAEEPAGADAAAKAAALRAELADGANWELAVDKKNAPFRIYKHDVQA